MERNRRYRQERRERRRERKDQVTSCGGKHKGIVREPETAKAASCVTAQ